MHHPDGVITSTDEARQFEIHWDGFCKLTQEHIGDYEFRVLHLMSCGDCAAHYIAEKGDANEGDSA